MLAYRRAATRIRETGSSIAELALAGKAKELPGIGATIEAKVVELTETGEMSALEKRRAEVPDEVTQFLRLPGLGPKTAARIWRELGVTSLDGSARRRSNSASARCRGSARRARRGSSRPWPRGSAPSPSGVACWARACPSCVRSWTRSVRTLHPSTSPPPAACGADARRSATST